MPHCDNMLMLLGACDQMSALERNTSLVHMMRGFTDLAREAGTRVSGGQTVINAWPLVGGVAMVTAREEDLVRPIGAQVGDYLVLTKALGMFLSVLHIGALAKLHKSINKVILKAGSF